MRFGTAIERLVDNYEYAKSKIWIRDKVAWALYHTWKEADRKTEPQTELKGSKRLVKGKDEPQTNADQHTQDVGSVESVGSNLEPFRVDEPQTERSSK